MTDSQTLWLPNVGQIMECSERALLASLDANLQLAVRVLQAQYPALGGPDMGRSPPELLAGSIVHLSEALHGVIASYRAETEQLHDDRESSRPF